MKCIVKYKFRSFLLAVCALGISSCSSGSLPPFGLNTGVLTAGVETVTLINTDKTFTDHLMSSYYNQDCSSVRYAEGGVYCIDTVAFTHVLYENLYCYRTIGTISCYDSAIPGYHRVDR